MYHSKLENPVCDKLFDAILSLKDREECYRFFDDLCTINEVHSLAQRYEVAELLVKGLTYQQIAEKTGASTATISRINRCLTYGADGYKLTLAREEKRDE